MAPEDWRFPVLLQMQSLPPNVAGGLVYQPGAPPSYPGTFSPAGSVEGSPMHNIYMSQAGQAGPGQYQAMPPSSTGEVHKWVELIVWFLFTDVCAWPFPDPNMVNAYMYQAAGTNGQPPPPAGQAPPATTPAYSNYQPTPAYQVWLWDMRRSSSGVINYAKFVRMHVFCALTNAGSWTRL